jgi:ferredoxin
LSTEHDCKHEAGEFIPLIDRSRCEGKGECVRVCPVSVYAVATLAPALRTGLGLRARLKGMAHRWQQALLVNPGACEACGLCVAACPEKAITLVRAGLRPRR